MPLPPFYDHRPTGGLDSHQFTQPRSFNHSRLRLRSWVLLHPFGTSGSYLSWHRLFTGFHRVRCATARHRAIGLPIYIARISVWQNSPGNIDLVMLIYGEFNVFRPVDIGKILDKSWQALKPGGSLLLEPHTFRMVKKLGEAPFFLVFFIRRVIL